METGPALNLDQLRNGVQAERFDTVLLAFGDMQGRLQGKRLVAEHFLDSVVEHGSEACNYLLAVDVEMNTVDGYTMSSWDKGYGDFELIPDFETLRPIPWHEKTALCLGDLRWADGSPVVASPRRILQAQLERLAERGLEAFAGTELEFIVFDNTYEQAYRKDYRELTPSNRYNVDYSILGTSRVEKLIGRIRREMTVAGMEIESSKGECNDGQHEINFRYGPVLKTAPRRWPRSRRRRSRSWPSTTSARAPRATSTSRCVTARARCSGATRASSTAGWRASSPACAS
jgi:glutamine synthetase